MGIPATKNPIFRRRALSLSAIDQEGTLCGA